MHIMRIDLVCMETVDICFENIHTHHKVSWLFGAPFTKELIFLSFLDVSEAMVPN